MSPESVIDTTSTPPPKRFTLPRSVAHDDEEDTHVNRRPLLHEDTWAMMPGVVASVALVAVAEGLPLAWASIAYASWLVGWS